MSQVYLGLGSNLDDREQLLNMAVKSLGDCKDIEVINCSSYYDTAPIGPDQPRFLNAVVEIQTGLSPHALLEYCLGIEQANGRVRQGVKWGPRRLDIDLLWFENVTMSTPKLTLPHPRLYEREFVLTPLREIYYGKNSRLSRHI